MRIPCQMRMKTFRFETTDCIDFPTILEYGISAMVVFDAVYSAADFIMIFDLIYSSKEARGIWISKIKYIDQHSIFN